MKKILVTGSAGFIGSALSIKLLDIGYSVVGIDDHNHYYDPRLKEARLKRHINHKNYQHYRFGIEETKKIEEVFEKESFDIVVNLAAQVGVRYSLENPYAYLESNLKGFLNILEGCRNNNIGHLIYASSSSVYGSNKNMPFSIHDNVDHPISFYAATKKANELMAHTYSHLYNIPTTGLRFFTVYGPWGRPDMALYKFAEAILNNKKIQVFNNGKHKRDFTYIDDIIGGICHIINKPATPNPKWDGFQPDSGTSESPWRVYNIGNSEPIELSKYIEALELSLGVEAKKEFLPMQPGDMVETYADIDDLVKDFNYQPSVSIDEGVKKFAVWFSDYFNDINNK
jgi:UDP-glucuronate 4-epimerase